MHRTHVIATCCYCGSRAALTLGGTAIRHELACSGCGAPLSRMKNLPGGVAAPSRKAAGLAGPARKKSRKADRKRKKVRKRRSLGSRLFDIAEDVLDEIFD